MKILPPLDELTWLERLRLIWAVLAMTLAVFLFGFSDNFFELEQSYRTILSLILALHSIYQIVLIRFKRNLSKEA